MKPSVAEEGVEPNQSDDTIEYAKLDRRSRRIGELPPWLWSLLALVALVLAVRGIEQYQFVQDPSNRPVFLTLDNLRNILWNQSTVGVIAVGMTFVIIAGGIDLSVGSLLAALGVFALWTTNRTLGDDPATAAGATAVFAVLLGYGAALVGGAAAGLINGVLIAKFRVAAFVVTLGGLAAYRSVAVTLGKSSEVRYAGPQPDSYRNPDAYEWLAQSGIDIPFTNLARPGVDPVPVVLYYPILIFIAAVILGAIVLGRTRFGRHTIAVGANERAARYSALAVDRIKMGVFVLLGAMTGLAAIMNTSRSGTISSGSAGTLVELDAIAAVVVGGTRLSGGRGTVLGTFFGVLILGVIGNMLTLLGVQSTLQGLVKGGVIVLAVLLQRRA